MKSFGGYLLGKEKHAIAVAFLAALLPIFYVPTGFIAVIITGLVTLHRGFKSGFWVLVWIALPAVAMLALRRLGLFDLLFLRCILMWVFAGLFYRYRSWNIVLAAMVLLSIIATLGVHIVLPNATSWWENQLTVYLQDVINQTDWHFDFTANDFAHQLAPMATGLVAFFLASTLLIELLIARLWQVVIVKSPNVTVGFMHIRSSLFFAMLPCIFGLLAYLKLSWALDILPITLFPLCIAGLSILHYSAHIKRPLSLVLALVYAGIILFPVPVLVLLAVTAFVDVIIHLRKRVGLL